MYTHAYMCIYDINTDQRAQKCLTPAWCLTLTPSAWEAKTRALSRVKSIQETEV